MIAAKDRGRSPLVKARPSRECVIQLLVESRLFGMFPHRAELTGFLPKPPNLHTNASPTAIWASTRTEWKIEQDTLCSKLKLVTEIRLVFPKNS